MQHRKSRTGFIFLLGARGGSGRSLQLRDPFFDLLGHSPADDKDRLRELFESYGYGKIWPELAAVIDELPNGIFVSIDYERGLQRENTGI
jgi:hypothetical protein